MINSILTLFNSIDNRGLAYLGAGFAMICVFGVGVGQGVCGAKSIEALARNPELASQIKTQFILAVALIETGAIYSLIISILLIFVAK